jgi:hypothetical protein
MWGQYAHASGGFAASGDAQTSEFVLRSLSTTTNTELFLDETRFLLVVPTNGAWAFDLSVVVQSVDGTSAAFKTNGLIKNVSGVMTLYGDPIVLAPYAADAGASTWTVVLSADTNNTALAIFGNSNTSTNRWVATVLFSCPQPHRKRRDVQGPQAGWRMLRIQGEKFTQPPFTSRLAFNTPVHARCAARSKNAPVFQATRRMDC